MLAYLVLGNLSIDLEILTKDGIGPMVSGFKQNLCRWRLLDSVVGKGENHSKLKKIIICVFRNSILSFFPLLFLFCLN